MKQIAKTLITRTQDLKPGDVIFTYNKGQEKKYPTWPRCNFLRVTVVHRVEQGSDGTWLFDTKEPYGYTSDNGDHKILMEALNKSLVLSNGTFGCNQRVEGRHENFHTDTYRLDNIKPVPFPNWKMPNLKGNSAYDLMM